MSQMKPYCFKCGAELDPDAIYCPECGRLQRSMVVRSVEPGDPGAPAAPPPGQPYETQGWHQAEPVPGHDQPPGPPPQAWQAQPGSYDEQPGASGDLIYSRHDAPEGGQHPEHDPYPPAHEAQGYDAYQQPEPGWSHQPEPHGQSEPDWYHPPDPAGEPAPGYGQPAEPHGQPQPDWGPQQEFYDQPAGYDHAAEPHGQPEPDWTRHQDPYQQPGPGYGQPAEPHGQPEPEWVQPSEPYGQPESDYGHPAESSHYSGPTYTPPPEPGYGPPDDQPMAGAGAAGPVYRSAAPIPRAGGYQPSYEPPAPAYTPPANPYEPPGPAYGQQQPAERSTIVRLVALVGGGLLALFLIGYVIGHLLGVGNSPSSTANQQPGGHQAAPTPLPGTSAPPTATPVPTATADTGTGNAHFQRVSVDIPGGHCNTSQGCPITVVLKNNGDRGSGSVTVTLTDAQQGGNTVGTFTGPVPATDAGATVTVTGWATSDQLPAYLRGGGTVYITGVTINPT